MILTDEIWDTIVAAVQEHPEHPVILPDWAYWKGRDQPVVYVDGLPENLSRVLYRELVAPIGYSDFLVLVPGTPSRNVNPHLFTRQSRRIRSAARCPNGHRYAGNEMPENRGRWRCVICYRAWVAQRTGGAGNVGQHNRAKQVCPKGHEYTGDNVMKLAGNRRRCKTCHRDDMRRYRSTARPTIATLKDPHHEQ